MTRPREMPAVALAAFFSVTVVAEHALRPALSPVTHRVSEYANGPGGVVMTAAFAVWAMSLALTAVAVRRAGVLPTPGRHGLALALSVAALGAAILVVCHTGTVSGRVPSGRSLSSENRWHDRGAAGLALALWAAVLVTATLPRVPKVRRSARIALAGAVVAAVGLSLLGVDAPGLRQRALLAVAVAWQLTLLFALRSPSLSRRRDSGCRRARWPSSTS